MRARSQAARLQVERRMNTKEEMVALKNYLRVAGILIGNASKARPSSC